MTLRLRLRDGAFFKSRPTSSAPVWSIDLDREPSPTVSATGIRSAYWGQHWLEEDDVPPLPDATPKPPFRVPPMEDVRAMPWNGLTVASTFAGAGGSSLGYRMAGFRVLWASEFVDAAREVYQLNARAGTVVDGRDIREVKGAEILAAIGLAVGELDVLDGSPPCASFSTAGKRQAHWGQARKYSDRVQRTDDLFFEFARIRDELMPKVFVAENVSGLVKGAAKGFFKEIFRRLKLGYRVEARMLDAQWLGVPQQRQRVIYVGVREDLAAEPAFPSPLPYRYSVREAIPWIGRVQQGRQGDCRKEGQELTDAPSKTVLGTQPLQFDVTDARMVAEPHGNMRGLRRSVDEPAPAIRNAGGAGPYQCMVEQPADVMIGANGPFGRETYQSADLPARTIGSGPTSGNGRSSSGDVLVPVVEPEADISRYAIGREADKLGPGEQSDRYFNLTRASEEAPSPAVTGNGARAGLASVIHPTEKRKFSIQELKRICAFPDDFVLTGSYGQQWERLGRAVPPLMMRAVAEALRDRILVPARERRKSG